MERLVMEKRARLRTYSHLLPAKRVPSEYEVVTSQLLYHPQRGFEVHTPGGAWYLRHQAGNSLKCADWDAFRDPRETTYTRYTALQSERETFAGGILHSLGERELAPEWTRELALRLSALRFPFHGLQMCAAYAGSLAPSGRIAIALLLQCADELRKVQRFAYRLGQLRGVAPDAPETGRRAWQEDPRWQPLRKLVEELLVTYDWSEAWVALNLAVKPALDAHALTRLALRARSQGDPLLAELLGSLEQDALWQRTWTRALADQLSREDAGNAAFLRERAAAWTARTEAAVAPLEEGWA